MSGSIKANSVIAISLVFLVVISITISCSTPSVQQVTPTTVHNPVNETPNQEEVPQGNPPLHERLRFETISLEQGLSMSVITDIVQDHLGFMWFGTEDGLNRFDGMEFVIYKHDPEDPTSLRGNWITALFESSSGILWMGVGISGLDRFDRTSGEFEHYRNDPEDPNSLSDDTVTTIYEDHQGRLWLGTANGLNRYDAETDQFIRYFNDPDDSESLSDNGISVIYEDQQGTLWVGTAAGGLNRFDPETSKFTQYRNDPKNPNSLISDTLGAFIQDPFEKDTYWIGTNAGLDRFNSQSGKFTHYTNVLTDTHSLSSNLVTALYVDRVGELWIGTVGAGVDRYDRNTDRFIHYREEIDNPNSLSDDQINVFYQDRSGVLWVGTEGGGLSTMAREKNRFVTYQNDPNDPNSLSNNQVWNILQDRREENIFWIATSGGGLNRFDRSTGSWQHYRYDPLDPNSISSDEVYYVYQDSANDLWIGTQTGGLSRYDEGSGTFIHYQNVPTDTHSISSNSVLYILEDRQGALWVATIGGGLNRFDRESEQFAHFQNDPEDPSSLSSDNVFTLHEDSQGELWIGTLGGGLDRFDREGQQFVHYQNDPMDPSSLSGDFIMAIYSDSQDRLWVATYDAGLNLFDREKETFKHYREKDGLPNDSVYGILEDDQGYLWLSTNYGLSRFDPRTELFKNYTVKDGLLSNEFNSNAFWKTSDGEMFFGGIEGIISFYPGQLRENPYPPEVVITDFQLFNEPVQVGEVSPLQVPVEQAQEITLSYRDDFFSFEFAALHYVSPEENQYAYRLEGFEENWNYIEDRNFAGYTNVPPGSYTFRVIAANNDGVWNEEGAALGITIIPPFWQTWWFRIGLGFLVVGAVWGAFNLRLRVIQAQKRQLEVQVAERTQELNNIMVELKRSKDAAEAANRAKSVFLANISHELRTPLNAILGFSQLMIRSADSGAVWGADLEPEQRENLEVIMRSGEHLLGLINDVLEMSKIEAGRTTLKEHTFDLHHMLQGLQDMFELRAEEKGLALEVILHSCVPQYVHADEGKLRQVLMNLLGNAVKFTQEGGVLLRVNCEQGDGSAAPERDRENEQSIRVVQFEIEDTGPGIVASEIESIFDPFVQSQSGQQAQEGTGLGLAISRQFAQIMGGDLSVRSDIGNGSVFSLQIPLKIVETVPQEIVGSVPRVVGIEPEQPTYRILAVDDKEVNSKLLLKMLQPLGFQVREASNGREAIEIWERWDPQLIWMDMRMPVMDGYEATRRIKATTKGQATVIIAVTASALEEDREIILSEGCDGYIRKPFRENEIFAALKEHLGVRFIYQQATSPEAQFDLERSQKTDSEDVEDAGLARRLSRLPEDWVDNLRQATVLGYLDAILSSIDQIRTRDSELAEALKTLAINFEHDKILTSIRDSEAGE